MVVVAIENQLGLKYLLGGAEDHHGKAWVGLADYPGATPVPRTWTRRTLADLFAGAGLTAQRWLLPYPDYKMPRLVLDESAFDRGQELVEKLVRDPLHGTFGGNDAAVSGRITHRLAMAEGIGALGGAVVPGRRRADRRRRSNRPSSRGWRGWSAAAANAEWRRVRRLDADAHAAHRPQRTGRARGPGCASSTCDREALRPGRAMDAHLLDAMRTGDLDELARLLDLWRRTCTEHAKPLDARTCRRTRTCRTGPASTCCRPTTSTCTPAT